MTAVAARLDLLGGFRASVDGRGVAVPTVGAKLLAYLALHERPLPRGHVAGTFWPDLSESRAHSNLRAAIWRLPEPLRPLVEATPAALGLTSVAQVDLHEMRCVVRDVLHHASFPNPDGPVIDRLCRPLLPEWDESWLVFERERLRQLHIHALERMGEHYLAEGDPRTAVDIGVCVVTSEPLRESAHGLLIRAHLAAGNRADAMQCYRRYATLLNEELGLEPSVTLAELAQVATQR